MKKNNAFRQDVKNRVEELLTEARRRDAGDTVEDICETLVSMVCDSLSVWQVEKSKSNNDSDDFYNQKERWIAR
mgnify:CR=1 FL=1